MRFVTLSSITRIPLLTLTLLAFGIGVFAQSGEAPKRVKITVEQSDGGQSTVTEKSVPVEGRTMINDLLREMDVATEMGELEPGEVVEITIKRSKKNEPAKEIHIEVDPLQNKLYERLEKLEQIQKEEKTIIDPDKPMLGVYYNPNVSWDGQNEDVKKGAEISNVISGTAAEIAGMQRGDVIVAVDGISIDKSNDLREIIGKHKAGDKVNVTYEREGVSHTVEVTLGEWKMDFPNPEMHIRKFFDPGEHGGMDFEFDFNFDNLEQLKELKELKELKHFQHGDKNVFMYRSPAASKHAFLGVYPGEGADEGQGAAINGVVGNSSASALGLQKGDVITEINGQSVGNFDDLRDVLKNVEPGAQMNVKYMRDGKQMEGTTEAKAQEMKSCKPAPKSCDELKELFPDMSIFHDSFEELEKEIEGQTRELIRSYKITMQMGEASEEEIAQLKKESDDLKDLDFDSKLNATSFSFYPNPTSGKFNVRFDLPAKGTTEIRVTDIDGRTVFNEDLGEFSGNYSGEIDITSKANGIYFLIVSQNNETMIKKIVKQ